LVTVGDWQWARDGMPPGGRMSRRAVVLAGGVTGRLRRRRQRRCREHAGPGKPGRVMAESVIATVCMPQLIIIARLVAAPLVML
jgi:hypothetical protein